MLHIISVYGKLLLAAMGQTLLLALCGLFFACIIGLIFGILGVLKNKACNIISTVFVDIIRGVPMIVLRKEIRMECWKSLRPRMF